MMEQLIEGAVKAGCRAEVFSTEGRADIISFENSRLRNIDSKMLSGVSLRVIRDNKQGLAFTRNLVDRQGLIRNAEESLKGGVDALFDFPLTKDLKMPDTYASGIESLANSEMVEECKHVCELLLQKVNCQINISCHRAISSSRLLNSSGTDLSFISSSYALSTELLYPYTSASIHRVLVNKAFQKADEEYISFLADNYKLSLKETSLKSGRMKVLFLPETLYVLLWRLQSAANSNSLYQNISPLAGRVGENIFDERFSVFNDPLNDSLPGARAFDDEGVPCRRYAVVENGVFRSFYYDLYFAEKLKAVPTGNGFRGGISAKPVPVLRHISVSAGDKSFQDIVKSVDRGIIVAGALGAHSGNIPNGDFSIGIAPALYVENGEITGHVKDAMAAGNIYETLNNIIDIENTAHPGSGGNFPAILFNDVNVTAR